jgi:hypothetical protein
VSATDSLTVRATGDSVGNNGEVEVYACSDGSVSLQATRRDKTIALWLTPSQAVTLATRLLVAAGKDRSQ